jgi:hypothetical protein
MIFLLKKCVYFQLFPTTVPFQLNNGEAPFSFPFIFGKKTVKKNKSSHLIRVLLPLGDLGNVLDALHSSRSPYSNPLLAW